MEARIMKWQEMAKNRQADLKLFEEMQLKVSRECAERRYHERVEQLIRQIPMRFRGKAMDDFKTNNERQACVKQVIKRYIDTVAERLSVGTSVRLMGRPGTGKTLLSLIVYQMLVRKGYSVRYEPSLEFVKLLLEIKFRSQAIFNSEIESLKDVQFIILDEVTESTSRFGKPTEIEKQLLFRIIDERYANMRATWVITNKDERGLMDCLGAATVDRLAEGGISLAFDWESYRCN